MALNSGHRVVERVNHRWNEVLMERFLEFFSHIISDLADTMQRCMSDLGVGVLKMLDDNWDHSGNLARLIDIFTDLRERKDTGILVPPIRVVGDRVLDKLAN